MFVPKPATDLYREAIDNYNKPRKMMLRLIGDINLGSKYIKMKHQKKFLLKCLRINVCPNEIRDLGSRIKSDKVKTIDVKMEKLIMKEKIKTISLPGCLFPNGSVDSICGKYLYLKNFEKTLILPSGSCE